jgi:predicted SnoaL-like aldol condensation-catalyzing enzyme
MITPEQNKEIVTRFNKEFIEQDNIQTLYELIDPEFINHSLPFDIGKGPDGVLYFFNYFLRKAFPDIKVEIYDQIAEGDKVVTHKSIHATHKGDFLDMAATNKEVLIDIIDIVLLKDGKFIEQWTLMDLDKVMAHIDDQEKVF